MAQSRIGCARLSALLEEYRQIKAELPHAAAERADGLRARLAELDALVNARAGTGATGQVASGSH